MNSGLLIVVSGPSGSGKGTVLKKVIDNNDDIILSVSSTTRTPRKNEIDGVDYNFISKDEFEKLINNNEIIEYALYCENYYGTPKKYIEESCKIGNNVILEIDVQGALQIKEKYPESILIFIMPPSLNELENRLKNRNTEDEISIKNRVRTAINEIKISDKYDYIVINDDIDKCSMDIENIIKSCKCKSNNMKKNIDEVLYNA